jgi:C-terminal processing protease CtpA/Prc
VRLFFTLLFCATFSFQGLAQPRLDSLFYRSDLIADLESFKQELLKSHPNPFEFCEESYFNKVYEASTYAIDERTSLAEYSLIVANLLNTLRDSHTAIDYGQLQDLQMAYGGYFLPIGLERVVDSWLRLLVKRDWEKKITPGSELLAVNGIDRELLFKHAMSYACIEGDADEAKKAVATSILMICAGLKNPFKAQNSVRVVDFNSGDTIDVELKGYARKEFYRERYKREMEEHPYPVMLDIDDEHNLAILKISTFAPAGSGKFKKRIRECFNQVQEGNYGNLVIDLRNNGGGSSAMVEYLYSFLDTAGYNTPSNVIGRNSALASSRSRLMYSTLGDIITFLFFARNEDVQSFRHFAQLPMGGIDTVYFKMPTRQVTDQVYKGNCFVLINGLTASAAVDFTNAFKQRRRGVIVGQQCLGPVTGTWGNPAAYTLEKTGLRVSIATIRYNYDNTFQYERNAIMPDHWVDCTAEHLNNQTDSQIDFVIKLLKKKR